MLKADKGVYKRESITNQFLRSCGGRLFIFAVIIFIFFLIAHLSVPSQRKMNDKITDDIVQCLSDRTSSTADKADDFVRNFVSIFTTADSVGDIETMEMFYKYNKLKTYQHFLYNTIYVENNLKPGGVRIGLGIFGIVIPMISYNDFILRVATMRKEYNQKVIKPSYSSNESESDADFGDTYNTIQ